MEYGLCHCGCGQHTPLASRDILSRGWTKGAPLRYIHGHNGKAANGNNWRGGVTTIRGYVYLLRPEHPQATRHGYVAQHRLLAEEALGRPLPATAEVHHVNEVPGDNRPGNLVICQDRAYHKLLHLRLRALRGCGNPDWRKCAHCQKWDDPANMRQQRGEACHRHQECANRYLREWKRRRKHQPPPAISPAARTSLTV